MAVEPSVAEVNKRKEMRATFQKCPSVMDEEPLTSDTNKHVQKHLSLIWHLPNSRRGLKSFVLDFPVSP